MNYDKHDDTELNELSGKMQRRHVNLHIRRE